MDGAQSTEALWQPSKTVDGIEEGRVSILAKGLYIEINLRDAVNCWLLQEGVFSVESDCMTQEVDSVFFKLVLLEDINHRLFP